MVDKIWYNMEELIGGSEERVLIETYWNVNNGTNTLVVHRRRINRNILECKLDRHAEVAAPVVVLIETYWNVNSVATVHAFIAATVLIETYWNVNGD